MTTGISYTVIETSLGTLGVGATGRGVCRALLCDHSRDAENILTSEFGANPGLLPALTDWAQSIALHIGGDAHALGTVSVDMHGTVFQLRVWTALREIPRGATATYTEVAEAIGQPGSVRAVAGACAANRIAVAIPCHRVIRADDSLASFRWGVERKRALLATEQGGRQLDLTPQQSLPF